MTEQKKPSLIERARASQAVRRELAAKQDAAKAIPRGIPPSKPVSTAPARTSRAPADATSLPPPNVTSITADGKRRVDFADSSNIKSAELHEGKGELAVVFTNGATATLGKFTTALLKQWSEAPSPGRWFHANVRSKPDAHPLVSQSAAPTIAPVPVTPIVTKPAPQPAALAAAATSSATSTDVAPSSSDAQAAPSSSTTPAEAPVAAAATATPAASAPTPAPTPAAAPVTVNATVTQKPKQHPPAKGR